MSLFDQLAGQAMSALGSQTTGSGTHGALLDGLMDMVNKSGGLPALLQKLNDSGLGDQVASWIGTGANQPVSGDQITDALGEDKIRDLAQRAGVAPEHASGGLAQMLPQIIDMLTPGGQVPHGDLLNQGLEMLKGRLFSPKA